MKTIRFDSIGGASGDMILGGLINLGVDINLINENLKSLLPNESFKIEQTEIVENGLCGVRTFVNIENEKHCHRHFSSIKKIINDSQLSDKVKENSINVFLKIAKAESKMHGQTIEEVHFHEVGAVDSIIDIVGSCFAMDQLGIDKIILKNLPVGCGTVKCAHGIFPVPAPATLEILQNFPLIQTDEPFELVTPTAAALLMEFKKENNSNLTNVQKVAYSFGHRKLSNRPNLLRLSLIENSENNNDFCSVLETNIDDLSPEVAAYAVKEILDAGALDVWTTPIMMKKQRSAILLSVICEVGKEEFFKKIIFKETTTFGIREYQTKRTILNRSFKTVNTKYGDIKIKVGEYQGEILTESPEIDDCIALAKKNNVSLKEILSNLRSPSAKKV